MFKVEDNYLSIEDHLVLKTIMESDNFPWYYRKGKVTIKDKLFDYQFVHIFYKDNIVNSDFFYRLDPIIKIKFITKMNCFIINLFIYFIKIILLTLIIFST